MGKKLLRKLRNGRLSVLCHRRCCVLRYTSSSVRRVLRCCCRLRRHQSRKAGSIRLRNSLRVLGNTLCCILRGCKRRHCSAWLDFENFVKARFLDKENLNLFRLMMTSAYPHLEIWRRSESSAEAGTEVQLSNLNLDLSSSFKSIGTVTDSVCVLAWTNRC